MSKLPDPSSVSEKSKTLARTFLAHDGYWQSNGKHDEFRLNFNTPEMGGLEVAAAMKEAVLSSARTFKPHNFRDKTPPYVVTEHPNELIVQLTPEFRTSFKPSRANGQKVS